MLKLAAVGVLETLMPVLMHLSYAVHRNRCRSVGMLRRYTWQSWYAFVSVFHAVIAISEALLNRSYKS